MTKLDQSARSRAGAVGVMQVIPRYAAGAPVYVRGVDQLEPNVEAGAKYLRLLSNSFLADSILEQRERWAFALAAYNAGPGRVEGLRRKARQECGGPPSEERVTTDDLLEELDRYRKTRKRLPRSATGGTYL